MEQKKARKAGIMDILRSPYAHRFFRKYKWSYLLGMAILIVIDSAQTEVPRIVGQVIDGIKYTTIDESGYKPLSFHSAQVRNGPRSPCGSL